ncbi:MAG TPA: hypothetical protein VN182_06495, partial [Flavobacterium sp.]|nr:hypothetical protein [Flavobacterium sp.]
MFYREIPFKKGVLLQKWLSSLPVWIRQKNRENKKVSSIQSQFAVENTINRNKMTFKEQIQQGIPSVLPQPKPFEDNINHAPKRKEILSEDEKKLALRNALRYFEPQHHAELIQEFAEELNTYGRIYMYRFRPDYKMYARPISDYPGKCEQAKAIMLMIQNNLDYAVAQHPHELITYGGNGAVFQNWAQYLLTMQY